MATNTPIDWKKAVIAKKTAKVTIDERVPLGKPFRSLSTDSGEQKLDRKVIREVERKLFFWIAETIQLQRKIAAELFSRRASTRAKIPRTRY